MTLTKRLAYLSIGLLIMTLSACSAQAGLGANSDGLDANANSESNVDQDDRIMVSDPIHDGPYATNPQKVVQKARKWLAKSLDMPIGWVRVTSVEQVEWSNSCLGLAAPGEACLMVITPGYIIVFDVMGEEYEVRTDMTANNIRVKQ